MALAFIRSMKPWLPNGEIRASARAAALSDPISRRCSRSLGRDDFIGAQIGRRRGAHVAALDTDGLGEVERVLEEHDRGHHLGDAGDRTRVLRVLFPQHLLRHRVVDDGGFGADRAGPAIHRRSCGRAASAASRNSRARWAARARARRARRARELDTAAPAACSPGGGRAGHGACRSSLAACGDCRGDRSGRARRCGGLDLAATTADVSSASRRSQPEPATGSEDRQSEYPAQ